jgi:hypothetical protein
MSQQPKHTPGPWKANTFEPEESKEHFVTAGKADFTPVCRTGRWDTASAADARLIAAAPEMLEALERVAHIPCERYDNIHCTMIPKDELLKACPWCQVRAAIAKAKGEL